MTLTTQQCSICLDSPLYDKCAGEGCARLAIFHALLIESRKWQALGEFGDPLGPECWSPEYADYMRRLDAATGDKK